MRIYNIEPLSRYNPLSIERGDYISVSIEKGLIVAIVGGDLHR